MPDLKTHQMREWQDFQLALVFQIDVEYLCFKNDNIWKYYYNNYSK